MEKSVQQDTTALWEHGKQFHAHLVLITLKLTQRVNKSVCHVLLTRSMMDGARSDASHAASLLLLLKKPPLAPASVQADFILLQTLHADARVASTTRTHKVLIRLT
jgi:hypothetical protein